MQKKSLLVALFCGALCLTGCLKNEESASVAQVRGAKAEELKSLAALNNAKAQAEIIYANAEATIANAEAKLREAQANLVNAQAETERVRAELLKVQVQLAEVKVEEEKVKLQMKEAELEQKLAEVEAAVAKADAEKQVWINALENAMAQAEVNAINNAQEILKAEEKLEEYLLTLEKAHADSAQLAAKKYFAALDSVQTLQKKLIQTKATKALVEAGALQIRDAIYYQIDQINDQIDETNAIIAALKERRQMTPEEAEAALVEDRIALSDAYAAFTAAMEDVKKAKKAYEDLSPENMKADFNNETLAQGNSKWNKDFKTFIKPVFGDLYTRVYDQDVTYGEGESAITKPGLKVSGLDVKIEGEEVFIPFWHNEDEEVIPSRYPNIDVVSYDDNNKPLNFVELNTTLIAPATIYFENIERALDVAVAAYALNLAGAAISFEEGLAEKVEGNEEKDIKGWKKEIAANEGTLALHQAYVDARKEAVAKAEADYVAELGKSKSAVEAKEKAWEAFQNYILINHNESRSLFINRYAADTAYKRAVKDTVNARYAYDIALSVVPTVEDITPIFEQFIAAEGAYNLANANANAQDGDGKKYHDAYEKAKERYNPDFAAALAAGAEAETTSSPQNDGYYRVVEDMPKWTIKGDPTIKAGTVQDSVQTYEANLKIANQKLYIARQNNVRYPKGTTAPGGVNRDTISIKDKITEIQTALTTASTGINAKHTLAKAAYENRLAEYEMFVYGGKTAAEASAKKAAIEAAYNPKFNDNKIIEIVKFPTPGKPNEEFDLATAFNLRYQLNDDDEWVRRSNGEVAGTAQGALISAVVDAVNNIRQTKEGTTGWGWNKHRTAYQKLLDARVKFNLAETELLNRNIALMEAHGVDFSEIDDDAEYVKEHLDEYLDTKADELYAEYKAVTNEAKVDEAKAALIEAYSFTPDGIGAFVPGWNDHRSSPHDNIYNINNGKESPFSWLKSSYHVNYEATAIDIETGKRKLIADILYEKIPAQAVEVTADYKKDKNAFTVSVKKPYIDEDGKKVEEDEAAVIPDITKSLTYQNEVLQAKVDGVEVLVADVASQVEKMVGEYQNEAEGLKALLDKYKASEPGYKAWVKDRQNAEAAYNQAKMDEFDAKQEYIAAKADLEADEAKANQSFYVYVGVGETLGDKAADEEGFVALDIEEQIKYLEGDINALKTGATALFTIAAAAEEQHNNVVDEQEITIDELQEAFEELTKLGDNTLPTSSIAELTFTKKVLEQALKAGKVGLQIIIDAFDEEIAELEEKIEVYTKIAETYKAIMNYYLGIADEAIVPDEEEIEGDDEE